MRIVFDEFYDTDLPANGPALGQFVPASQVLTAATAHRDERSHGASSRAETIGARAPGGRALLSRQIGRIARTTCAGSYPIHSKHTAALVRPAAYRIRIRRTAADPA